VRLILLHARAMTLELVRYPAYVVPTRMLPAVFFLFFVPSSGVDPTASMVTFAGFAVIGVAFFQFGVGIAGERDTPWEAYVRTLPIGAVVRLGARLLSAAVFAAAAATTLIVAAVATTQASLAPIGWFVLAGSLLVGTVPFALLGIALGYWVPARAALPIANLLYLALSYAGGLWFRARHLPHPVAAVSPYLPTRALADALLGGVSGRFRAGAWLALGGFAALFGALAAWGYRRDEGRRFR
jgi:ABC-2 type transport system permease protein